MADARRGAAARLEASDDLILRVMSLFRLDERLRLASVSKRWQMLVLFELCIPSWHFWRAPAILRRAAGFLRVCRIDTQYEDAAAELVRALCASGATLHTLVLWGPVDSVGDRGGVTLSAEQALQISASCAHLDASTRLAFAGTGAAQAVALLDALPGRHAVRLERQAAAGPDPDGAEAAALTALLRHPGLCALSYKHTTREPDDSQWLDAVQAAVLHALSPQGQREGSALERLDVRDGRKAHEGHVAFPDVASVADAFGPPGPPPPQCSLRGLYLQSWAPPSFVRGVLAASRGSLRLLETNLSGRVVPGTAAGAAVLAAVLECLSSLETIDIGGYIGPEAPRVVIPGLAPLLASPDCRLSTLTITSLDFTDLGAPLNGLESAVGSAASLFSGLLHAITANRSLRTLQLDESILGDAIGPLLGAALAARTAPLDSLRIGRLYAFEGEIGGARIEEVFPPAAVSFEPPLRIPGGAFHSRLTKITTAVIARVM